MAVPKLKFKADDGSEFPEWEEKCIDTEFDFYNGVAHENNVVEKGKYIVVNSKFISSDGKIKKYSDVANFPLMIDDIVMVMSDVPNGKAIAKCFLIDKNDTYTLNQRICCLRTKHNAIFMLNQINRNNYFLRFDDGIKQTNLRKEDILRCPIYVPSVLEQQKMAEFLYTIDEIIQSTESELTAWQERKKGVMQKIFNREVRFKADDGSEFPEWEEKRLDEVVEFLDGLRKPLEAGERVAGPYPYYGASGIIDYVENYIFDDELILLSEDGANIIDRNYRVAFLAKGKYWVNNHAHVLKAVDSNVNYFICEQLESFDYRKYNSGGAQPKLNQATCRSIIMRMPCVEEQKKIADCLSSLDDVINQIDAELSAWKEFKKGLLQQMFV